MTIIEQLEKMCDGEGHLPKVAVTRDFLRALATEFRRLSLETEAFDLVEWMSQPSRKNPLASAAAVHLSRNLQKTEKSGVNPVDGSEHHD